MKIFIAFAFLALIICSSFQEEQKKLDASIPIGETIIIDVNEFKNPEKIYTLGDASCVPIPENNFNQYATLEQIPLQNIYNQPKVQNVQDTKTVYWTESEFLSQIFDINDYSAWFPTMVTILKNSATSDSNKYKFLVFNYPLDDLNTAASKTRTILVDSKVMQEPDDLYDSKIITADSKKLLILNGKYLIQDSKEFYEGFTVINVDESSQIQKPVHQFKPLYDTTKYSIKNKHLQSITLPNGEIYLFNAVYVADNNPIIYPPSDDHLTFIEVFRYVQPHQGQSEKIYRLLPIDYTSLNMPSLQIIDSKVSTNGNVILYDLSTKSLIKVTPTFAGFTPNYQKESLDLSKYSDFIQMDIYERSTKGFLVALLFKTKVVEIVWEINEEPRIIREFTFNKEIYKVSNFAISDEFIILHYRVLQQNRATVLVFNRRTRLSTYEFEISTIQGQQLSDTSIVNVDKVANILSVQASSASNSYLIELKQPKILLTAKYPKDLSHFTIVSTDRKSCPVNLAYQAYTQTEEQLFDCITQQSFNITIEQYSNLKIDLNKLCKGNNLIYVIESAARTPVYPIENIEQKALEFFRNEAFTFPDPHHLHLKNFAVSQMIHEWRDGVLTWLLSRQGSSDFYNFGIEESNNDIRIKELGAFTLEAEVSQIQVINQDVNALLYKNARQLYFYREGKEMRTVNLCSSTESIVSIELDRLETTLFVIINSNNEDEDGYILYTPINNQNYLNQESLNNVQFKRIDKNTFKNSKAINLFIPRALIALHSEEIFIKSGNKDGHVIYFANILTQQIKYTFVPPTTRIADPFYFVVQQRNVGLFFSNELFVYSIEDENEIIQKAHIELINQREFDLTSIKFSDNFVYVIQDSDATTYNMNEVQIFDLTQEESHMKYAKIRLDVTRIQLVVNKYQDPKDQNKDKIFIYNDKKDDLFIYHIYKKPQLIIQNTQQILSQVNDYYPTQDLLPYLNNYTIILGVRSEDSAKFTKEYPITFTFSQTDVYKQKLTFFAGNDETGKLAQNLEKLVEDSRYLTADEQKDAKYNPEFRLRFPKNKILLNGSSFTQIECSDKLNVCCQNMKIKTPFDQERRISNIQLEQRYFFDSIIKSEKNQWIYASTPNKIFRFTYDSFTDRANAIYDLIQLPFHQNFKQCKLAAVHPNDYFTVSQCFDGTKYSLIFVSYISAEPHVMGTLELPVSSLKNIYVQNNYLFVFDNLETMFIYKLLLDQRTSGQNSWYELALKHKIEHSRKYSTIQILTTEDKNVLRIFFGDRYSSEVFDIFLFNGLTNEFIKQDRLNFIQLLSQAQIPIDFHNYYQISDLEIAEVKFFYREDHFRHFHLYSRYNTIVVFKHFDSFYLTIDFSNQQSTYLQYNVVKKFKRYGNYINQKNVRVTGYFDDNAKTFKSLYVLIPSLYPQENTKTIFTQQLLLAYDMDQTYYFVNVTETYKLDSIDTNYAYEVIHFPQYFQNKSTEVPLNVLSVLNINPITFNLENLLLANYFEVFYNSNELDQKCESYNLTFYNEQYSKITLANIPIKKAIPKPDSYEGDKVSSKIWVIFVVIAIVAVLVALGYFIIKFKNKFCGCCGGDDGVNAVPIIDSHE